MYHDGRRKNFYDGKGHTGLAADLALCRAVMDGARLAHANLPNWVRQLLPVARDLGLTVACDLQDVVDPANRCAAIVLSNAMNEGDHGEAVRVLGRALLEHAEPSKAGRPSRS